VGGYAQAMTSRTYTGGRGRKSAESVDRVLEAAERLIKEGSFHLATMEELSAAAGVSRATVFNRFGSKLGVLQALFTRGMEGPEMQAIRAALELEDPVALLEPLIEASCTIWELQGYIHEQLEAIAVLEPGASALTEQQRDEQRVELQRLARRLARAGSLRPGISEARAAAVLDVLMSLESYLRLRRDHGLSVRQTRQAISDQVRALLR
jgi:AcrR family transcriptional regulator